MAVYIRLAAGRVLCRYSSGIVMNLIIWSPDNETQNCYPGCVLYNERSE